MDRIELYRIFACVSETRSFTRAADRLQIPRSTVSAAVGELEARLKTRLLNRTTRVVTPTREGLALRERCLSLIAEADEMETMFRAARHQLSGQIRVDVPGRIGRLILAPALPAFLDAYPGLSVSLGASDRALDLFADQIDCALRVGPLADSQLRARPLGRLELINVASPAYLARMGEPRAVADLDRHFAVPYASPSTGRVEEWEWCAGGEVFGRPVPFRATANSAETQIACALAGLGLIQVPAYDVAGHIAAGELAEVMPHLRPEPMRMTLLFPSPHRPPRRLSVFADWLEGLVRRAAGVGAPA